MAIATASDERSLTLVKKASASVDNWATGDAAAPGAGARLLVLEPVRPTREIDPIEDDAIGGEFAQSGTTNGGVKVECELKTNLHYQATTEHLLFAMLLGRGGGTPSTPAGGVLTRDQYFELETDVNGLCATLAEGPTASHAADQHSISVVPSIVFNEWTLTGEGDGVIEQMAKVLGIDTFLVPAPADDPLPDDLTLNTTAAAIANATNLSTGRRLRMGDLKVYIDDIGGSDDFAGVAGGDYLVPCGRIEVGVKRDQAYPDYGSQDANAIDGVSRPMMPVNNAQHVIPTFSFQLKRWEDDEAFGWMVNRTQKRVRLEWTGALIEGAYYQRYRIDLPCVVFKSAAPDKGKGNIQRTVTGSCYAASSTPTGFSTTNPIRVSVRNQVASNILA